MQRALVVAICLYAGACGDNAPGDVTIVAPSWADPLHAFAHGGVAIDGASALPDRDIAGFQIGVLDDAAMPAEGYLIPLVGLGVGVLAARHRRAARELRAA